MEGKKRGNREIGREGREGWMFSDHLKVELGNLGVRRKKKV